MTARKKPVTEKPVIEIDVKTAELLVSAVMKMKLWADPGEIKYMRRNHDKLLSLADVDNA